MTLQKELKTLRANKTVSKTQDNDKNVILPKTRTRKKRQIYSPNRSDTDIENLSNDSKPKKSVSYTIMTSISFSIK